MSTAPARAELVVDLDAIAANTAALRERVGRPLMAVVKADGYGHGLVPSARAALAGGADALGVAVIEEALALRAAGVTAPLLAWLNAPGEDFAAALSADVEVSVNATWGVEEVVAAARATGRTARLHLKVDTGLSRGGATPDEWPDVVASAARAQAGGEVEVVGLWSHLAYADAPTHPTIGRQRAVFEEAVAVARDAGLRDARRHLANSAATVALPETWYDLVRPGIAIYGLDPLGGDPAAYGLRPAMTGAGAGAADQAGAGRRRGLLRAHLRDGGRDDAGHRARRVRRRHPPRGGQPGAGPGRRGAAGRSRAGSAWTSSCSTSATPRCTPGTASSCGARAPTASRRRSSGPTRSTPSTTSWWRASAAGSPGGTSGTAGAV